MENLKFSATSSEAADDDDTAGAGMYSKPGDIYSQYDNVFALLCHRYKFKIIVGFTRWHYF